MADGSFYHFCGVLSRKLGVTFQILTGDRFFQSLVSSCYLWREILLKCRMNWSRSLWYYDVYEHIKIILYIWCIFFKETSLLALLRSLTKGIEPYCNLTGLCRLGVWEAGHTVLPSSSFITLLLPQLTWPRTSFSHIWEIGSDFHCD